MKIVEDSPDRLVLAHQPVGLTLGYALALALILAGGVVTWNQGDMLGARFLGALGLTGLVAALLHLQRTTVTLDRRQREVTIRRRAALRRTETGTPLAAVRRAEIQSRPPWFNRRLRKVHRPALELTDGKRLPLTPHYSEGPGAGRAVQAINRWLGA